MCLVSIRHSKSPLKSCGVSLFFFNSRMKPKETKRKMQLLVDFSPALGIRMPVTCSAILRLLWPRPGTSGLGSITLMLPYLRPDIGSLVSVSVLATSACELKSLTCHPLLCENVQITDLSTTSIAYLCTDNYHNEQ